MTTKRYEAVSDTGKVFKRETRDRRYTHCVVTHIRQHEWQGRTWPGYCKAEWAGSLPLAQRNASSKKGENVVRVEILEAREVTKAPAITPED